MLLGAALDENNPEAAARWVADQTGCLERDTRALASALSCLLARRFPDISLEADNDYDRLLLRSLAQTFDFLRSRDLWLDAAGDIPIVCDATVDGIADRPKQTPIFWLNYCLNYLTPKTMRSAVVASVRNEGPWIVEWLAHYKALGIDRIVIYYNDNDDESDVLLRELSRAGEIVLVENVRAQRVAPQMKVFGHALQISRLVHAAEWVAFLDLDEFLTSDLDLPTASDMLGAVLQKANQSDPRRVTAISVNWDWFSSVDCYGWGEGLVTQRFNTALLHKMKKCFFRPEFATSMLDVHFPRLAANSVIADCSGAIVDNIATDALPKSTPLIKLNHYFAKSFEEFSLKKLRGRGAVGADGTPRGFEAFLWAGRNLSARTFNARHAAESARQLDRLLKIGNVRALHDRTTEISRARIRELSQNADLRGVYCSLFHSGRAPALAQAVK